MEWMRVNIFGFVLLALSFLGCQKQARDDPGATTPREVYILIDSEGHVFVDGERVELWYIERQITRTLRDEKAHFVITAAPGTPMGVLSDVQNRIPAANLGSIHYPEPGG